MIVRKVFSCVLTLSLLLSAFGMRVPAARAQAPGSDDTGRTDLPEAVAPAQPESFTDQIIVRYKDGAQVSEVQAASADSLAALSAAAGVTLTYFRPMSGDAHVLTLPQPLPDSEVAQIAARIAALPEVEYAEPDSRMFPLTAPNDPLYRFQWHYSAPARGSYGANLPAAWDVITGSLSIVVAVLDSGILFDHPHLSGRTVGGYDMVSHVAIANDGDGRDASAADPGDWIDDNDLANPLFNGCSLEDSSHAPRRQLGSLAGRRVR